MSDQQGNEADRFLDNVLHLEHLSVEEFFFLVDLIGRSFGH